MKIWNYILMCVVVLCTSCASSKKVVYLQDVVPLKQQEIEQKYEVYIHNDDLLAIMVNSKNPELALPFNMPMVTYQLGSESAGSGDSACWAIWWIPTGTSIFRSSASACGGADAFAADQSDQATPDRRGSDQGPDRDGAVLELQGVGDG